MPRKAAKPLTPEQIEAQALAYRDRLVRDSMVPPPTKEQAERARAARLMEALGRTETLLAKSDHRRLGLLLKAAKLQADKGDFGAVYGCAAEILGLCRTQVLGIREAHPVSMPASRRLSELPPPEGDGDG